MSITINKYILLKKRLKQAANKGNKIHVMISRNRWIVYEGSKERNVISRHQTRKSALNSAKKLIKTKEINKVILHNENGNVDKIFV